MELVVVLHSKLKVSVRQVNLNHGHRGYITEAVEQPKVEPDGHCIKLQIQKCSMLPKESSSQLFAYVKFSKCQMPNTLCYDLWS